MRLQNPRLAAVDCRGWLHIGDEPHRGLEEESVRQPVPVAADATTGRIMARPHEFGRFQSRGVSNTRMAAALVYVAGTITRGLIQLGSVWRPELRQLIDAVAHSLLPLAFLQPTPVVSKALHYVVNAARAAQVRTETRETVIDDVCMRVVEARQNGAST